MKPRVKWSEGGVKGGEGRVRVGRWWSDLEGQEQRAS